MANSNFVLFVFFVAACAIYLRDLGSSTGWTDLVFFHSTAGTGGGLYGMSTDGTALNAGSLTGVPLSPVCALAH